MSKEVIIKINKKTGEMETEVNGVMGGKCTEITDDLLAGDEEMERQYTEEHCVPQDFPAYNEDF